jgi:hypothetical protein
MDTYISVRQAWPESATAISRTAARLLIAGAACHRSSDCQSCCYHHSYFSFGCCFTAFSRKFL